MITSRPGEPVRTLRRTRHRLLGVLLLAVVGAALIAGPAAAKSTPVTAASGSATATGPTGPVTKSGDGTVTKDGKVYDICVPFFAKGVEHTFEIKNGATVVDSFKYTVPSAEGTASVTTDKGVKIEIATTHTGGVNGSPSKGCFTYKPPKSKGK